MHVFFYQNVSTVQNIDENSISNVNRRRCKVTVGRLTCTVLSLDENSAFLENYLFHEHVAVVTRNTATQYSSKNERYELNTEFSSIKRLKKSRYLNYSLLFSFVSLVQYFYILFTVRSKAIIFIQIKGAQPIFQVGLIFILCQFSGPPLCKSSLSGHHTLYNPFLTSP